MSRYNVLHVDDNPDFTHVIDYLIHDIKKQYNVEYEAVRNSKDALDRLDQQRFQLLIADLMLRDDHDAEPGMDFVQKIYDKKYAGLKIMVLSARSDSDLQEKVKPYVIRYVTKDFQPSAFSDMILDLLEIKSNMSDER